MKNFIAKFGSRKFLLTVAGLLGVTAYPQYADSIVTMIGLYLGAEGAADTVRAYSNSKYVVSQQKQAEIAKSFFSSANDDEDDVDKDSAPIPGM